MIKNRILILLHSVLPAIVLVSLFALALPKFDRQG